MKAGIKTTEFWLTIATNLGALLATLAEALDGKTAAVIAVVANGLYALSRGWAKSKGQ